MSGEERVALVAIVVGTLVLSVAVGLLVGLVML